MNDSILLTIVIPAYNMEKYLHRCLDSIIVENVMDRVQVIVVNDGSKDRTSEIAHEYENKYPYYIQVIDKENGNYGSCMNVGLSLAKGKYFRTLDADDWYDTPSYERFVNELEKTDADMLLCERFEYFEETGIQKLLSFSESTPINTDLKVDKAIWSDKSVRNMTHVSSICYKRDILIKADMRWDEKVFYTDNEYLFFPLDSIDTIRLLAIPVYVYLKGRNDQSVSLNSVKKNFHSYDVVTNAVLDRFISNVDEESPLYEYKLKIIQNDLLPYFYLTLFLDGLKNKEAIDVVENKIRNISTLYESTERINNYRGLKYVSAYRHKRVKYWLIRLDYLIRSNKMLRRLIGKHE